MPSSRTWSLRLQVGRDRVYGRGMSRRIRFGGVERYRANRCADSALASRGGFHGGPVGRPGDVEGRVSQRARPGGRKKPLEIVWPKTQQNAPFWTTTHRANTANQG